MTDPRPRHRAPSRVLAATVALSLGLLVVGWFDYRATRRDLLALLVEQATSLRQVVVAAARSADAASAQAQASLSARLLDNARMLARLDASRPLTQATLDDVARQHGLFRVTTFSAAGQRDLTAGIGGGPPAGGGRGFGPGPGGAGAGFGGSIAERLLAGPDTEAVSEVHGSRWGRGWRMSAGVRRANGGAIVLNVDASSLAELRQQASINHLLADIADRAKEVAYVVLVEQGAAASAHGRLAEAAAGAPLADGAAGLAAPGSTAATAGIVTRELMVAGVPVLEFTGPIDPAAPDGPSLRLGLSLEGLRSAERRSLVRLAMSLLAALGLGVLAIALVVLRQEHGVLREEHARAQEALRRRDRLAAMGELASTVAHEVRNPLNAIGMSVQRLRREFVDAGPAAGGDDGRAEQRELLDVLSSETQRINRIVQQFLEYARPPQLVPRRVDVAALLANAAAAAQAFADTRGVRLDADVAGAGDAVVDPDQVTQAIGNLIRNAIEASPAGAAVTVRATRDRDVVRMTVEDRGPGIAPEHLTKIFDLYFTTKADGTGIGLAVTHRIVEAHGGTIDLDSAPGTGTTMTIALPIGIGEPHHG